MLRSWSPSAVVASSEFSRRASRAPPRQSRGCDPASSRNSRRRCSASHSAPISRSLRRETFRRFRKTGWRKRIGQPGVRIGAHVSGERRAPAPRCTAPSRPGPARSSSPTTSGCACAIEVRNASTVWPLRIRPERSVTVPEMISGTFWPRFLENFRDGSDRGLGIQACRKWFRPSEDRRRLRAAPSAWSR